MKRQKALLFVGLLFLSACSTPEIGPTGYHSTPGKLTVAIMAINDIHGALEPREFETKEPAGKTPVKYERGGLAVLAGYASVLRQEYGSNFIILDAGDEFQGSVESNSEKGAPVVAFLNALGVTAATIGNHEFDFGPAGPEMSGGDPQGSLKQRMSEAHYPYLSANIIEKGTGAIPAFPNLYPSKLFILPSGVKIGIIGLATRETPVTTRAGFVKNLDFSDMKAATLREAKELRAEGAELIVVDAHSGMKCDSQNLTIDALREPQDFQGECGQKDEMVAYLKSVPPGAIDAVVSGHTHQIVHHWVNGVPVVQAGSRANYFNILYLTYDPDTHSALHDETRIEGPVPVCPLIFENQMNCDGDRPAPHRGRGKLVRPYFHGKKVVPDPAIEDLFRPVFERTKLVRDRVIGQAVRRIDHRPTQESELGDLVADAIRESAGADVALANAGGIRAGLEPGPITYEEIFRALPFENAVSVLKVSGLELKRLIRVAESGQRGVFPVSGLRIKMIHLEDDAPASDLNGDHRISPWEVNRIVDIRLANGRKIQDNKMYRLATIDFLVTGGDDMGWPMSRIPDDRKEMDSGKNIRDVVADYISHAGPLNSPEKPILQASAPRFIFVHGAKSRHGRSRGHSRRHRGK